jgi:hypothetical protein
MSPKKISQKESQKTPKNIFIDTDDFEDDDDDDVSEDVISVNDSVDNELHTPCRKGSKKNYAVDDDVVDDDVVDDDVLEDTKVPPKSNDSTASTVSTNRKDGYGLAERIAKALRVPIFFASKDEAKSLLRMSQVKSRCSFRVERSDSRCLQIACLNKDCSFKVIVRNSKRDGYHIHGGNPVHSCEVIEHHMEKHMAPTTNCNFLATYLLST